MPLVMKESSYSIEVSPIDQTRESAEELLAEIRANIPNGGAKIEPFYREVCSHCGSSQFMRTAGEWCCVDLCDEMEG